MKAHLEAILLWFDHACLLMYKKTEMLTSMISTFHSTYFDLNVKAIYLYLQEIINITLFLKKLVLSRAVKSCQKTHPGNRSRQHRLTVYMQAYSHVDQGRSCHLCQTQFKGPGHYLCE